MPAFFFPPLAFFAIVCYPPLQLGSSENASGSQYFITHSPQPHLDGRYTVFGRVIAGMDVVDKIQQWDVIRRVRIWDGTQTTRARD